MSEKSANQRRNHLPSFSFFEAWKGENVRGFNRLPQGQSNKSRDGRNPQHLRVPRTFLLESNKSRDGRNPQPKARSDTRGMQSNKSRDGRNPQRQLH